MSIVAKMGHQNTDPSNSAIKPAKIGFEPGRVVNPSMKGHGSRSQMKSSSSTGPATTTILENTKEGVIDNVDIKVTSDGTNSKMIEDFQDLEASSVDSQSTSGKDDKTIITLVNEDQPAMDSVSETTKNKEFVPSVNIPPAGIVVEDTDDYDKVDLILSAAPIYNDLNQTWVMLSKKKINGFEDIKRVLDAQGYIIQDQYEQLQDLDPKDYQNPDDLAKSFQFY